MSKNREILIGLGAALVVGVASMGGLAMVAGGNDHPAQTAAHQLPKATTPTATITLPQATKTIQLPGATITKTAPPKVIIKKVPQAIITCGHAEDDCYPDYIGKGRWVIRHGERPLPQAKKSTPVIKKVPKATIVPGVCKHPAITTRAQLQDCIELAGRPKGVAKGKYEIPAGRVLVGECTDQYRGRELSACLKQ